MINGYWKQTKILGEYTDFYLYGEQSDDHHSGIDLMMKQLVLDLRPEGFGIENIPE